MPSEERHIDVRRTARYHVIGDIGTTKELWIVLHGYGQLARYFLNEFNALAEGRCIVAPEGLSRFYLDGSFGRVGATWMTREDRESEIADQISYLDDLVKHMTRSANGAVRVRGLGFSQGVATLCRWGVLGVTQLEHMVIWGGSMPPELTAAQMKGRWRATTIDLVHGEQDKVVDIEALRRNEALLRGAGLAFGTHVFEGGHTLNAVVLERLMA
jgi:predicted esterase